MKKLIVMALAILVSASLFAGIRVGVDQAIFATSVSVTYDGGRWFDCGVKVGLPLINGIGAAISEYNEEPRYSNDEPPVQLNLWTDSVYETITSPRAEIFAHFKAVDTKHFDLAIGAMGVAQSTSYRVGDDTGAFVGVFVSPQLEIGYKLNEKCRIYIDGQFPLAGTSFTFGDSSSPNMLGATIGGLLIQILDVVHLGVTWAI